MRIAERMYIDYTKFSSMSQKDKLQIQNLIISHQGTHPKPDPEMPDS